MRVGPKEFAALKQKMCQHCSNGVAQVCLALEEVEILALLPVGGPVVRRHFAALLDPALIAPRLVALELEVVVDEHLAELLLEKRFLLERFERRRQALR